MARRSIPSFLVLIATLLSLRMVAIAAADGLPDPSVERANPALPLADFELTNLDGKPQTLASLRGKPVLVFFGFAHCPDICPTTLHVLKTAHEAKARGMRQVQVLMISVDGERDTPAAMKAYLAPLSKDFIGFTGHPRTVLEIAKQFQGIFFKGPPLNAAGDYNMQHTSQVYLVDAQGRLRASFSAPSVATLVKVTTEIRNEKS